MADWAAVALRFAVYLDLMLLFGLAAYPLYAFHPVLLVRLRSILAALAVLGFILSTASFLKITADMAGLAIADLDRETLQFVVMDTTPGTAFLARSAALILAIALAVAAPRMVRSWLIAATAAVALGTLAWTGHAAVTEGLSGSLHRLSDVVHLLAAAAWIGALAVILKMLALPSAQEAAVADLQRALAGFAVAGSVLVAVVIVTGLVNGWMIIGAAGLPLLPTTLYGQLLIVKLLLFAAMLGFATVNRWRLTPSLATAQASGDITLAVRALRTTVSLEAAAAIIILGLVAWLGTLAPPSAI